MGTINRNGLDGSGDDQLAMFVGLGRASYSWTCITKVLIVLDYEYYSCQHNHITEVSNQLKYNLLELYVYSTC